MRIQTRTCLDTLAAALSFVMETGVPGNNGTIGRTVRMMRVVNV